MMRSLIASPASVAPRWRHLVIVSVVAAGLAGCAKFTPDGGMAPVADRVATDLDMDTVKIASPRMVGSTQRVHCSLVPTSSSVGTSMLMPWFMMPG